MAIDGLKGVFMPIFLTLDGIKGEVANFKDAIELDSWSWGVSRPSASGAPASQTFVFTSIPAGHSPQLTNALVSNETLENNNTLSIFKHGDVTATTAPYISFVFGNGQIESYQIGGAGGGPPLEQFSLNFEYLKNELGGYSSEIGILLKDAI